MKNNETAFSSSSNNQDGVPLDKPDKKDACRILNGKITKKYKRIGFLSVLNKQPRCRF